MREYEVQGLCGAAGQRGFFRCMVACKSKAKGDADGLHTKMD